MQKHLKNKVTNQEQSLPANVKDINSTWAMKKNPMELSEQS